MASTGEGSVQFTAAGPSTFPDEMFSLDDVVDEGAARFTGRAEFKSASTESFQTPQQRSARRSGEGTPLQETSGLGSSRPMRPVLPNPNTGRLDNFRNICALFALVSLGVTVALVVEIATGEPQIPPHGAVSSCNGICSEMGVGILKRGGSAVDAAITTMLCVGVVNPQYAGLGGGGFMLVHDHRVHKSTLLDFRERAPSLANRAQYASNPQFSRLGGLAVAVPGELAGMKEAHARFGRLKWPELFTPVIALAREGFNTTYAFERSITRRRTVLSSTEQSAALDVFLGTLASSNHVGTGISLDDLAHEGTLIRRPDLAATLALIAVGGADVFYRGALAREIVASVKAAGGVMTMEDLAGYNVTLREPLVGRFRDYIVETFPAPSSGSVLLALLSKMDEFEFDRHTPLDAEYYRFFSEAQREAYNGRWCLGDGSPAVEECERAIMNRSAGRTTGFEQEGTTVSTMEATVSMPRRHAGGFVEDFGTSHVSVVDKDELIVSVTHSLNEWFGSLVLTSSGLLLNNEMADFDVSAQGHMPNNLVVGGARPLSSMTPTIVYNAVKPCKLRMSIGGTNGTRIPAGVAQTIANVVGFRAGRLSDAILTPRIYCTSANTTGAYCDIGGAGLSLKLVNELRNLLPGVEIRASTDEPSIIGAVAKNNATTDAFADSDNGGLAAIY